MCYVFEKQYMIGKVLGKNTRVSGHSLLQGIFLTQGWNPHLSHLLHCRQILYHLSEPPGKGDIFWQTLSADVMQI